MSVYEPVGGGVCRGSINKNCKFHKKNVSEKVKSGETAHAHDVIWDYREEGHNFIFNIVVITFVSILTVRDEHIIKIAQSHSSKFLLFSRFFSVWIVNIYSWI